MSGKSRPQRRTGRRCQATVGPNGSRRLSLGLPKAGRAPDKADPMRVFPWLIWPIAGWKVRHHPIFRNLMRATAVIQLNPRHGLTDDGA
jgi:hypothetical protein